MFFFPNPNCLNDPSFSYKNAGSTICIIQKITTNKRIETAVIFLRIYCLYMITYIDRLVFNLKRILEKVPFGKSQIASYAAALFLLKEETGMAEEDLIKVLEDLGHDTSIDLNEEFKEIHMGEYILNHDLMESKKGTIVNLDNIEPVGQFAGVPIYRTQEKIFRFGILDW